MAVGCATLQVEIRDVSASDRDTDDETCMYDDKEFERQIGHVAAI